MPTPAQLKASREFKARREAAGARKVTVWLSEEARFRIKALAPEYGSNDLVVEDAVLHWYGHNPLSQAEVGKIMRSLAEKPAKPASAPEMGGGTVRADETVKIQYGSTSRPASVPVLQRKAFNPQPKGGKK